MIERHPTAPKRVLLNLYCIINNLLYKKCTTKSNYEIIEIAIMIIKT